MMTKKSLACSLLLLGAPLSLLAAEIVIQAGETGTSSSGSWHSASAASMPYEGNKGLYTLAGEAAETYTFAPALPETTTYRVDVYNSCYSPRSHQVTHYIHHASGTATHIVEQDCQIDPLVGQWRTLGNYVFNAGTSGSLVIDTTGSNNSYIGATAVRFVSDSTNPSTNTTPSIISSQTTVDVQEGESLSLSASATDLEDGDISNAIQWSALSTTGTGENFSVVTGSTDFVVTLQVQDSQGATAIETIAVNVIPANPTTEKTIYEFGCTQLEPLQGFTTNNPEALPNVGTRCGKYVAELTDNADNKTLHYHNDQGRFDGVLVNFPFTAIARNVGTAPMGDADGKHNIDGSSYHFAGLQIHHSDLNNRNSVHLVAGQRGYTQDTIEGKMTRNGVSNQNDIDANRLDKGRADLMITGDSQGNITAYWQLPNLSGNSDNDNWNLYRSTGILPGELPQWDGQSVYVGLITYAYYSSAVPFMGVADSLEIID